MVDKRDVETGLGIIDAKLSRIRDDIDEIKEWMRSDYVRRNELDPVRQVVFGMVAVVMLCVVGGLLSLVLRPQ